MDTPGISFSLFDNDENKQGKGANGAVSPQEAIRVLSLHIPKVVGAYSPIPSMLLNAQGSAGLGSMQGGTMDQPGGSLEEILRRLFGGMQGPQMGPGGMGAPAGQMPPAGSGGPPAPRVDPGKDERKLPDPGEETYPGPSGTSTPGPTEPPPPPPDRMPRDRRV